MKKSLLMFLAVFAGFMLNAQTVQRTVLIEQFTNASCPPCAVQNPAFNALLESNAGKVAVIKYQTNWPGYDPMNEQTQSQVGTRVSYYGVTGVPNVRIDGTTDAGTAGSVTQAKINTAYAIPAPLQITLTHSLSTDLSQITINCDITNPNTTFGWTSADAKLRIGVIEQNLYFPTPPGSTDETHFNYVMRQMYPDATGTAVAPIPAGGTVNYTWTVDLPDYIYNYNEIGVVAFVQSEAAKTTYQAAISHPIDLGAIPNTAYTANTTSNSSICNQSLTPSMKVKNEGTQDITSFEASYSVNGGTPVVQSWTGILAPNNEVVVTFDPLTITGMVGILYDIDKINGDYFDINALNDDRSVGEFGALSASAIAETRTEGFEDAEIGWVPDNSFAKRDDVNDMMVANKGYFGATGSIGGFAASEKTLFVEIYNMLAGTTSSITFDKLDWTNRINDSLTFDVSYRQYQGENDKLQVQISTDCGVTWQEAYSKSGSALSTVGAATAYFVPTAANQWRKETVDLAAWDGATDVIVRFFVTSAYGNNMFIDNVNIAGTYVSGVENAIVESKVNVYPNPASSLVNIDFTMAKANNVSVQVYDVAGKLVTTLLDNQVLGAGVQNVQWNNPASTGLYFVKIRTEEGEVTRKISVLK